MKTLVVLLVVLAGCRSAQTTSAILYIDQKQYDKAVKVLHEGLSYNPEEADAYFYLGEAHSKLAEDAIGKNDYLDSRKNYELAYKYYNRAKELGVEYIRCRPARIDEHPHTRNLSITYLSENERKVAREYDMVVLAVAMEPRACVAAPDGATVCSAASTGRMHALRRTSRASVSGHTSGQWVNPKKISVGLPFKFCSVTAWPAWSVS